MRQLYELGAKTGLTPGEVNRIAKLGVLGLLAFGMAALVGCFKSHKSAASAPASGPETLQDLVGSVNASTAAVKRQDVKSNCGPYPGYPCGTRYFTVSRLDFGRRA